MSVIVTRRAVLKYQKRFPTLFEMGLMDEDFAVALAGADALKCRPCDVRRSDRMSNGSYIVSRIGQ